jgi:hypothetical protein
MADSGVVCSMSRSGNVWDYNETRTHLGLGKDAPLGRHIEPTGTIVTTPILSRLHIATRGYDFREVQGSRRDAMTRLSHPFTASDCSECVHPALE